MLITDSRKKPMWNEPNVKIKELLTKNNFEGSPKTGPSKELVF
jgi:hypothetical protein